MMTPVPKTAATTPARHGDTLGCAAPRRFRPSPLLRISVAVHAIALTALLAGLGGSLVTPAPPWAGPAMLAGIIALVLNHLVLTAAGLWPRSQLLGPNLVRLPPEATRRGEIAITIDDGPDPDVTPAVLDCLQQFDARATFFVIARRAERHPALIRRIVAEGHTIGNHSDRHSHRFSFSGPGGFDREIARAQAALQGLTGQKPAFFRAPAGLRNPFLEPVLCRHGLTLTSWTRRGFDTRERNPDKVLARLIGASGERLAAGDILLLHDGHAARDRDGRPVVLTVLPALLETCARRGLRPIGLDAADRDVPVRDATGPGALDPFTMRPPRPDTGAATR